MIKVNYKYRNREGVIKEYEEVFFDIDKASRFCWSMKDKYNYFLEGFSCDIPSETEEMINRVNLYVIQISSLNAKGGK